MKGSLSATEFELWRGKIEWLSHKTRFIGLLQRFFRVVAWPVLTVQFRGLENLPASGPCILAPNHVSNFDPFVILVYMPRRYTFFMAKKELFRNPFLRWYMPRVGAFPVDRSGGDVWALKQAGKILQAGQVLGMFPEGTRSRGHAKLKKGKLGTARLALEYGVSVVPVAILGTEQIRPGRRRARVTVRLGKPLDVAALAGPPPHDLYTLRDVTTCLMQQIAALLPPSQRGYYA